MAIECQFQTGAYTRQTAVLKSQSVVEIKFSGQELGEVVAVYPQISLNSCEASSGRVNYGGRLVCSVVYTDEQGKLCRLQKGAEFSHYADDDRLAPASQCSCALSCERVHVKREGSSIVASIVVGAEISVFESAERKYATAIDGAVCLTENCKMYSAVNFSGESELEDEFDCVAEDVLIPAAKAIVTDCHIRTGLVEVSGEVYLSLLAVRENTPVSLDRTIPFKCEFPCDEALLSQKAFCRAELKNINVNCRVNEESLKCGVEFTATLGFAGHFFEEEEAAIVTDAFCKNSELNLSFDNQTTFLNTDVKVYSERISGPCASKAKLNYTCAFLAVALPRAEFSRTPVGIEGSVTAVLIYEQGGEIHSAEVDLPFAVNLSGLSENCTEISVAVSGMSLRQRAEGECEAEATLKITAADGQVHTVAYLTEAEEGAAREAVESAVSVYIPCAGDGLWDMAKKLCENPEDVKQTNPELGFPLTGKERIVIYRGKC